MIPVYRPVLAGKEAEYVDECMRSNWISHNGNYNKVFEDEFAHYCDVQYGIGVTNGTSALHLALRALEIGYGDEVIVPDFTMASCGFVVDYCNATPVFVDSDSDTWNIDPARVEEKISEKTKAIMVVHIFGHPCEMDELLAIAKKHNLQVIEDCAEAHGALYKGKKVGGFGHCAAFSFYANKIITTGEGGMLITNDVEIAERARWLHSLTFDQERRFIHQEVGHNYRMTNLQAAIGLAQLERIETIIENKREIAAKYNKYLRNVQGITLPPERPYVRNVFWMYGILVESEFGMTRDHLKRELYDAGIDSRFFFSPLHSQPCFSNTKSKHSDFSNSISLSRKGFYLPSSMDLTDNEISHICNTIALIQKKFR